ncbi:MAG TPA: hypothetical protein VF316_01250 [Polyangiaceae bacterium]
MRASLLLGPVVATIFVAVSGVAHAGTFDVDGRFSFDPRAILRETFVSNNAQKAMTIVNTADALEGATIGVVDTTSSSYTLALNLPKTDASYSARMFLRKNRAVVTLGVGYPADGGSPGFFARFYPTGVVTSDGWYEVVTAPFSFQGSRAATASVNVSGNGVEIDAFEIVPDGAFRALSACVGVGDPVCRGNEACMSGWCRDGNLFLPPLPPPSEMDDVVTYFENRFRFFFGGRASRETRLPIAIATLEEMRKASSGWEFWNGLGMGIRRLHDWHTTINGPVSVGGRGVLPVCFVEGDGDLSHGPAPADASYADVLVSHVGPSKNLGLKAGDRLVAVNGMHPIAFSETLESVDWGMWRADDPRVHAEPVERMSGLIRRFARNFTIVRCASDGTCSAPETIDVASLPVDDGTVQSPYCDHRPGYHLAANGPNPQTHNSYNGPFHGLLADSQSGENLYGMIWDDVYLTDPNQNPYAESMDEFRAKASGVILDHRLGNGGTAFAAEYLTSLFRTPKLLGASTGFHLTTGLFDAPFTPAQGLDLFQIYSPVGGDAYNVGDANAKVNSMPTALLLARDGSASDWFPLGMVDLPNVRVFGRRTAGAFSSFIEFDYFGQFSWRLASGDLVHPDGITQLGTGVAPAEDLVPKQSDLVQGKDTVYLRALDWIRTCTGCR